MHLLRTVCVLGALCASLTAIEARAAQAAQISKDGVQEGAQVPSTPLTPLTPPGSSEAGVNEIPSANPDSPPLTEGEKPSTNTPDPAKVSSETNLEVSSPFIQKPSDGKGQVIFYRPQAFVGMAISFKVRENGIELGTLSNGRYFVHETDPGTHVYVVHSETKDTLILEVEPGESYFVQGGITMGVMVGRPNLSPSDQISFAKAAEKMKRSDKVTD